CGGGATTPPLVASRGRGSVPVRVLARRPNTSRRRGFCAVRRAGVDLPVGREVLGIARERRARDRARSRRLLPVNARSRPRSGRDESGAGARAGLGRGRAGRVVSPRRRTGGRVSGTSEAPGQG